MYMASFICSIYGYIYIYIYYCSRRLHREGLKEIAVRLQAVEVDYTALLSASPMVAVGATGDDDQPSHELSVLQDLLFIGKT